ncbi:MAG TPA: hypothetical protein VGB59_05205 [Allosphingosinicella sp.]|jgi:cytochrome oxidase Cu insertion factor (SCO1/SenC/PrrC family)
MLRALLLIIALIILIGIALVATGVVGVSQTQQAKAPGYEVKVNDVDIGTTTANVQLPTVQMQPKQVEVPALTVDKGTAGNAQ